MKAKLFLNGGSQAVRLPKSFKFHGESEVEIHKCGNKVIIEPVNYSWESLLKGLDMLGDGFDFGREKPDFNHKDLF